MKICKEIEQLKELLDMQKALDEAILKERGIEKYPLEEMKIALFVELGELMNELLSKFKFWKKNPVDNREKELEEYVDCLSFKLSLINFFGFPNIINSLLNYDEYKHLSSISFGDLFFSSYNDIHISSFFGLGHKIGFTWEEVYNAYKKKNKLNYERLKNGY